MCILLQKRKQHVYCIWRCMEGLLLFGEVLHFLFEVMKNLGNHDNPNMYEPCYFEFVSLEWIKIWSMIGWAILSWLSLIAAICLWCARCFYVRGLQIIFHRPFPISGCAILAASGRKGSQKENIRSVFVSFAVFGLIFRVTLKSEG